MKVETIKGAFQIAAKAENPQMPQWMLPIVQQLVPNFVIPLTQENKQIVEGIQQQAQAEQMQAMAQAQQMQEQQQMPDQSMPPEMQQQMQQA